MPFGFSIDWPLTWRVVARAGGARDRRHCRARRPAARLRDDGETERAAACRCSCSGRRQAEAAALARKGARNMFPDAKLKTLPPLMPGSKREQFRERRARPQRQGEVTTLERNGAVYFLVLNASTGELPEAQGRISNT